MLDAVVRPRREGVRTRVPADDENTLLLTVPGPMKLSIEPNGKNGPLLLFVNSVETDAPKEGDMQVIYFGPGVHTPGRIDLASGQTLYIAGGAIVKGGVMAQGKDIRI